MTEKLTGDLIVRKQRFAVLSSRFNDFITGKLRDAAIDTLKRHGCPEANITEVQVPGAFELPLVARKLASTKRFDAVIALGCIIRGATPHFDYLCSATPDGLARVSRETGLPVPFGVPPPNPGGAAVVGAGIQGGNEGAAAARAACRAPGSGNAARLPLGQRPEARAVASWSAAGPATGASATPPYTADSEPGNPPGSRPGSGRPSIRPGQRRIPGPSAILPRHDASKRVQRPVL